jgi:hypothetical protein
MLFQDYREAERCGLVRLLSWRRSMSWVHPIAFLTWVSSLVTNGVVSSGHMTALGKPYKYNDIGAPTDTQLVSSGIIMAFERHLQVPRVQCRISYRNRQTVYRTWNVICNYWQSCWNTSQ